MEKIYELREVISNLDNLEEGYYSEFLNTRSLDVGVIKLREGQEDDQSSHSIDDIYYVIEGKGLISINGKNRRIS